MACVSKNNNGQAGENIQRTLPMNIVDFSPVRNGVSFDEMEENQNDEVSNSNESNDAGIL